MNWKKIVAYIPCQVCFYIGHWTSLLIRFDCMSFLYPVYNRFMLWSCSTSDFGDIGMWQSADENSRIMRIMYDYAEMLICTDRKQELKDASWYHYATGEETIYHQVDPYKMTPELEKKMRRELVGYKRQTQR